MIPGETESAANFRKQAPILQRDSVASRALIAVVAIMSFLAALTVGAVRIAQISSDAWRGDLSREATIQIKPAGGRNLDADVQQALAIAEKSPGVAEARVYSKEESEKLLEPWLGSGVDWKALPVPRLIRLRLVDRSSDQLAALRRALAENVPTAALDDHRAFSSRLSGISHAVTLTGMTIFALVLCATVLSVSFATRGAVAANRPTVEVLHFVGARDSYIAGIFQRHFLEAGLKGGLIGGAIAALMFLLSRFSARLFDLFSNGGDAAFLFTSFNLDTIGYLEIGATVLFVALVAAASSRFTVYSTLRDIG